MVLQSRARTALVLVAALFLVFVSASPAAAQSAGGTILGTVLDTTGAPLPGASVTARNIDTGATRSAVAGGSGTFTIPLLPVGPYEVSSKLSGFSDAKVSNVTLAVGTDVNVKVVMKLASVSAEITVTSEAPLIESTRSEVSAVVNERMVANLPTNGRNFIDFVLTTPGVTKDNTRSGDISFAGQRGTLNSLVVDGADNNNNFFGQTLGRTGSGRAPYQFSQDAVKEFQVNTNAYSAEFGRAGGAVINVVTKSGTNEYHGTAFEFYRDKSLNANDYINVINGRVKGPYHFNQFGASLGGPLVRDQIFFFANYDGQRNTLEQPLVLNTTGFPTDANTVAGLEKINALAHPYGRGQDQDVFLVKADAELSGKGHLSIRYNRQNFTGNNNENGGTNQAEEHSGNSLVKTDTISASFSTAFGQSFFNEVRAQYGKDSEPGEANSTNPEATILQGGQTFFIIGRNSFSPRETTINKYQIADTATLLFGPHTVKGGFDFSVDKVLNYFPGNFGGIYRFNSIAQFNRGKPSASGEFYDQAFAGPGTSGPYTNPDIAEIGIFAQDEWRAMPNLTFNAGIRYDREGVHQPDTRNPDPQLLAAGLDTSVIPEDGNNFGVRLGVAWTPKGSDRTVVRAGYGMFYGRTPAIMLGTAMSNNGINILTMRFTGASAPTYPNAFPEIPTGGALRPLTIFVFDKDFENPLVHQASVGVEHGFTSDISVGVSYLYVKGTNLQRSHDINNGTPVLTPFQTSTGETILVNRFPSARPFTNFARVIRFESTAESNYNGVTLDIQKRYSNHWQARIAYTLGKVLDTKPDATAVVPGTDDRKYTGDPSNFDADYGPGDADQRHRVVLSGVWNLDYFGGDSFVNRYVLGGWSLSGIVTVQTGQPFTAVITSDINNDQNAANDHPGFGRNTFNYPLFVSVDPRITKDIPIGEVHLQLIAEAFNIFNRSNVIAGRTNFYALSNNVLVQQSNFGQPLTSAGPRIVQIAAKVVF